MAAQLRETSFLEISRRIGQRLAAERGAQGATATAGAARGAAPRKVAVVTASLGNGRHAPTQMALAHAGLLIEQGLAVC